MTVNLLTQRLKAAKRELTALKTAHKRGLGNMKVYQQQVNLSATGHELGFWYVLVDVDFDQNYAAYPFAQSMGGANAAGDWWSVEPESVTYTSGYHAQFQFVWLLRPDDANFCFISSSSPIIDIEVTWRKV